MCEKNDTRLSNAWLTFLTVSLKFVRFFCVLKSFMTVRRKAKSFVGQTYLCKGQQVSPCHICPGMKVLHLINCAQTLLF